jgi:hypothetical protein
MAVRCGSAILKLSSHFVLCIPPRDHGIPQQGQFQKLFGESAFPTCDKTEPPLVSRRLGKWVTCIPWSSETIFQRELYVPRSLGGEDLPVVGRSCGVLAAELLSEIEDRGVGEIRHIHPELQ